VFEIVVETRAEIAALDELAEAGRLMAICARLAGPEMKMVEAADILRLAEGNS